MVEYVVCNDEIRVRFAEGPYNLLSFRKRKFLEKSKKTKILFEILYFEGFSSILKMNLKTSIEKTVLTTSLVVGGVGEVGGFDTLEKFGIFGLTGYGLKKCWNIYELCVDYESREFSLYLKELQEREESRA